MKQRGYHVEIISLRLASSQLALRRIGGRVRPPTLIESGP